MPRRQALVAEDPAELVYALEAAHQQPLQVQLERDPKVQVAVERVVVGHERTRVAASGNLLQHRRLDLEVSALVVEAPDRFDDACPRPEDVAHARVRDQVHVSLPVADLDVFQSVPLVGQRSQRLREQHELTHLDGRLAPSRREHRT